MGVAETWTEVIDEELPENPSITRRMIRIIVDYCRREGKAGNVNMALGKIWTDKEYDKTHRKAFRKLYRDLKK